MTLRILFRSLFFISLAALLGCAVSVNDDNHEKHHTDMVNEWTYWVGYYHGTIKEVNIASVSNIPRFIHHIEVHHPHWNMTNITPMAKEWYFKYFKNMEDTNKLDFQMMTTLAIEEGY